MTLLGDINSLRELGGARRLIEDEVRNRLAGYGGQKRVGERMDYSPTAKSVTSQQFANRFRQR